MEVNYFPVICFPGKYGELIWKNNWISFLDTMLQMSILHLSGNGLCLPTRIKSVTINPLHHGKNVYTNEKDQSGKENSYIILLHYPIAKGDIVTDCSCVGEFVCKCMCKCYTATLLA